ncbi:MAG TPA: SH3 domain-containing protein, partial [Leptospiraceae bacterium]|nr:SH3 domain-containing protein [Leptospiraceae bacterium]
MNPQNLIILLLAFILTQISPISAQANKKKTKADKDKKIITETIKNIDSKKEDDMRDADDDDKPDSSEPQPKEKSFFKVIAKNGTPLRDKPKLNGKKLLVIPEEVIGEILEETKERESIENRIGNWLKVEYNGKTGWIFSGATIV